MTNGSSDAPIEDVHFERGLPAILCCIISVYRFSWSVRRVFSLCHNLEVNASKGEDMQSIT